ncbi:hypothetical protein YN1_1250 [Nanoarchaeota archaeon]
MNNKYLSYTIVVLLLILSVLILFLIIGANYKYSGVSGEYSVYIPAVLNESGKIVGGEITQFFLRVSPGTGKVYASIPPIFYNSYNLAYLFAKDAVCNLYQNICNNYDYYFSSNDVLFAEGFSGTAGLTLLILEALTNKTPVVNYPITGFMLPNGIIAPVAGIRYKLSATLQYFPYLVAPVYNNSHIIQAYTILDLEKIYFNQAFNTTYYPPEQYVSVMENITDQICQGINNQTVNYYISKGDYYTATSLCFEQKVTNPEFYPNITEQQLENDINNFYDEINNYQCLGNYECEEIKYQVIQRLEDANSTLNNLQESYWRYYSAVGWAEFLPITFDINRLNECNLVNQEYTLLQYIYQYQLPTNLSCFDKIQFLANLYYLYLGNDTNYMNENAVKSIEELDYYYYNKYGFSITSYNYLQFGKDLFEMNQTDPAFYYLILSVEYAV